MGLNNDLIMKFQKMTRYDLQKYLLGVETLSKNHFGKIVQYYTGKVQKVPSLSLTLLDSLVHESERLDYIIGLNVNRFDGTDWWDLLEIIESTKIKLKTMQNAPKWARASVILSKRSSKPTITVQLLQNQTVERLAGGSLGYENEHQDWYDIAIRNDLTEEDYSPSGGTSLSVSTSGGVSYNIVSVVDIIDKETMKGKDVYKKFTWESDDLKTIVGDECFLQACEILLNLMKGDNPEFVFEGLGRDLVVGQNVNSIAYPMLTRQITETLNRDDTIDTFSISKIEKVQDGLFVELEIISKSAEIFNISTTF